MSRSTTAIVTAAAAVVAGLTVSLLSGSTLIREGVWGPSGLIQGHLDFTAAALFLVGLALLLMGMILLLATVTDYWMDAQDQRDALRAGPARRTEDDRYRLAASLDQTRPDVPRRVAH